MSSHIHQKVLASTINCLIVITASLPIYLVAELEVWKISTVILFFAYNLIFRHRCIGMMMAGTYLEQPASLRYIALYTVSFCSCFWYWQWPFDLFLINGICLQIPCVIVTGNTFHGYLAQQYTMKAPS